MKSRLAVIAALIVFSSSCQVGRFIFYNFSGIGDHTIFPKRDLHANSDPFRFKPGPSIFAQRPKGLTIKEKEISFEKYLKNNKTVAFLIIHDDVMVYERYFSGYDSSSIVPSFSMANAYTSALIGCAIADGFINSVNEPVTNYVPELRKNGFEKVTIKNLLQMTSGIDFSESYYDPLSDAAALYYGTDLRETCKHYILKREPGKVFDYTNGSTQLLGFILERALRGETITHYFDRRLWFPMRMEFDGSWSMEKKEGGLEKTFCCINARARDFAKFGRLYLNNGRWDGKQLVPAKWVAESTLSDQSDGGFQLYKYQWWLDPTGNGAFYAEGHLGQYIYVHPGKKLVIVRLGKGNGDIYWPGLFADYASTIE